MTGFTSSLWPKPYLTLLNGYCPALTADASFENRQVSLRCNPELGWHQQTGRTHNLALLDAQAGLAIFFCPPHAQLQGRPQVARQDRNLLAGLCIKFRDIKAHAPYHARHQQHPLLDHYD